LGHRGRAERAEQPCHRGAEARDVRSPAEVEREDAGGLFDDGDAARVERAPDEGALAETGGEMRERELEITPRIGETGPLLFVLAGALEPRAAVEDQSSDGLVGRKAEKR